MLFWKGKVCTMKEFDFAVIGGDKRTAGMAQVLAQRGYSVICYGVMECPMHENIQYAEEVQDAIANAPVILCGIPFEKEECLYFQEKVMRMPITELQRMLRKKHKIFGGVIPGDFKRVCEKRNIGCFDYMQEEALTIYNAIATAEGAVLEALLHKNTQLHQSKALVLGFGRCGMVLADKLKGLSAMVTVCSEQSVELATAEALGFETLYFKHMPQFVERYEYIFNTIPAMVLDGECLRDMREDALVIDIASNRVGVDYNAADLLHREVLYCPGLPGKYASLSCAERLVDFVLEKCIKE